MTEPSSPDKLRQTSNGRTACTFQLERNGVNYVIRLVDNTERNKKYNIIVTRENDPTDTDYLSIS